MNEMSNIVYGLWRLEGLTSELLEENLLELKKLGINTIDTARVYSLKEFGDSERLLGEVLHKNKELKDYYKIVTKCGIENINGDWSRKFYDFSYENIVESAKKSIDNLKVDKIDLFLLHRPSVFMDYNEVYEALKYLKDNNLVSTFGVSNYTPIQFESLNTYLNKRGIELVTNQIEMNPITLEHLDNDNVYYLKGNEIIPMIWSPMAGGDVFKDSPIKNILEEIAQKYNVDIMNIIISYLNCMGLNSKIILGSHKINRYEVVMKNINLTLTKEEMFKILQTTMGKEIA